MISIENLPSLTSYEKLALQIRNQLLLTISQLGSAAERAEKLTVILDNQPHYDKSYLFIALEKLNDAFEQLKQADHAIRLMSEHKLMS